MEYTKKVLATNENYKITYYTKGISKNKKCVITFGEIDSTLEETGFGSKLIVSEGYDHIYVAHKRHTQYQFLSTETFYSIVHEVLADKEVYTYGSSLGGYCAIYYGGIIDANILAMSPRIPAHPVIDKIMGKIFKNKGFHHNELIDEKVTSKKVFIFYDNNNYIDSYYIDVFVKSAYPDANYFHIENAGHYSARALLLSGELKKIALDFFENRNLQFSLNNKYILDWHIERTKKRIEQRKFFHARENIDVLLSSERAKDKTVRDLVNLYRKKLVQRNKKRIRRRNHASDKIHPVISKKEEYQLDHAISLSFVGDLILLRDQILNSYNPETKAYEFDNMFTYIKKYLNESDFSMGVFEGSAAGDKFEYSTSMYADGIPVYLNYPDSFAYAARRAGFDFVTTAQNHLLDYGVGGAMRTLDVLDKAGLLHLGSYRNMKEKEMLPIFNIKGLKIAILTYTKQSNHYNNSYFLREENKHLTSILVSSNDKNFNKVKNDVLEDFERVKKVNPDCIVVLPHMGQQFRHSPDNFQKTWCNIFVEAGADVILNDHPHAVQPYEWRKKPGEYTDVLILHCPGNFVNSYIKNDGDASALTQVYLNPKNGKPFALSCVPLWAHSYLDSNYRALPIYDIVYDKKIRKSMSKYEFDRVKEVHELITKTMLGERLSIDQIQDKYYLFAERANDKSKGYVRNHVHPLEITEEQKCKKLFRFLSKSKSVCFIGDSVTEGTWNGGYGWYEPLIENFKHLKVKRFAKGKASSSYFAKVAEEFAKFNSDLYIIAVGTNDVRYRDPEECPMTSKEYINNIDLIVNKIKSENKSSKFVFIAPWTTDAYDPFSKLSKNERFRLLEEYSIALKKYANSSNHLFINPNPIIQEKFKTRNPKTWLKDHIHPNAHEGIELYSYAVMEAAPQNFFASLKKLIKK